jgi:DNA-binding protein H-NS
MAKTYEELQNEIALLQAEAEALREKEMAEVIVKIRLAIDHYRITAADLGFGRGKADKVAAGSKPAKPARKAPAEKGAPRKPGRKPAPKAAARSSLYRDEEGRTWGGRGKRPRWLHEALAAGRKLEDFLVPQD